MLAAGAGALDFGGWLGLAAVFLAAINVVGGFWVTHRMLKLFRRR
ncbi:MAG: proton-translocating transhydrogenase family protein [Gemmatimonadales bacterium]